MTPLALLLWLAAEPAGIIEAIRKLSAVFGVAEAHAAEPVDPNRAFYEGAIPGLMRQLDPHSVFFTPGQFDQLRELERSTTKGFGTVVSVLPGRVIILQTLPETPSARAGLLPGDEIVAVNGLRLDWLAPEQLVELLGETRRKEARLDVRRTGSVRLLQFTLTPEDMAAPSVDRAFLVQPGIGYVRITAFETGTGRQLREAVEKLGGASLRGLLLDLRDNPGGLLPAAVETASLFLKPGTAVLSTRGRAASGAEVRVPADAQPFEFPLAVLVNGKTGSASEIVAGALQDHRRAVIAGETTFGKGLVQSVYPLSHGTGLALTTAFYYTPAGRSIQRPLRDGQLQAEPGVRGGITPDRAATPESFTRLRAVLDATAAFTAFAGGYLRRAGAPGESFEVGGALMDEFRAYLGERKIQPGVSEWSKDTEWIRSRLKQEIFNLSLGVAKGDEVEAARDPVVGAALAALQ